jgi:ABC-type transport system involved in multi-copper enzyme maturation permease subunit
MFWPIVRAEQTKIFKRKIFWVELACLLLVSWFQAISRHATALNGASPQVAQIMPDAQQVALRQSTWPLAFASLLNDLDSLIWLVVIVLVGALVAQEYGWHTLQLWLSRGVSRTTLLLAKATALLVPVTLFIAVPFLLGSALTARFSLDLLGGLNLGQVDFSQVALALLRTIYGVLPYAALALLLAVISRSPVAPLGAGIAFALVEIVLLLGGGSALGAYVRFLPRGLASSLASLNQAVATVAAEAPARSASLAAQPSLLPPPLAALGVAAWLVVCLGAALLVFRRQDLTE